MLCINLNEKVVNVGFYAPVIRQSMDQKKKVLKKRKMDHDFALRLDPTIQIVLNLTAAC